MDYENFVRKCYLDILGRDVDSNSLRSLASQLKEKIISRDVPSLNKNWLTCYKSPFPKLRLGKDFDGGYIIADLPNVNYNIILAGGIACDISFEEDFIKKYPNVKCYAYDGTIKCLPKNNDKIKFINKNIGNLNTKHLTNLHDIIDTNDDIFIKMDIEGAEFLALNGMKEILKLNKNIKLFTEIEISHLEDAGSNYTQFVDLLTENNFILCLADNRNEALTKVDRSQLEKILNDEGNSVNILCIRELNS